jgi:hypothetical protein
LRYVVRSGFINIYRGLPHENGPEGKLVWLAIS